MIQCDSQTRFRLREQFRDVTILGSANDEALIKEYTNQLYDAGIRTLSELDGLLIEDIQQKAPTTPKRFSRFVDRLKVFGSLEA